MLLTHSKKALSCRTLLGCGIFICTMLFLAGCSTFGSKSNQAKVTQFKQDTSVGTEGISIAAIGLVDVPYRYGGNTPKGGFDCSGLIVYVYNKTAGIKLPRTIQQMSTQGYSIENGPPAPGDLVFFNHGGRSYVSHVGIYLGGGRMVHAPHPGARVKVTDFGTSFGSLRFAGARRI